MALHVTWLLAWQLSPHLQLPPPPFAPFLSHTVPFPSLPSPQPRCPGCVDSGSQSVVKGFISEMAAHLRANAPSQLVAAGTEGYFLNSYEGWNTGAGARCEGEDWVALNQDRNLDVTVAHVYDRQVRGAWGQCVRVRELRLRAWRRMLVCRGAVGDPRLT